MTSDRVDFGDLGLDEVLLDGVDIHIERLDRGVIFIGISRPGDRSKRLALTLSAQGKTLRARVSENDIQI